MPAEDEEAEMMAADVQSALGALEEDKDGLPRLLVDCHL